jgi:hypothetical protein
MRATMAFMIHAQIAIPDASQCLLFAAPFLGAAAIYWLFWHSDKLINWIFPNWTWEKELGWLNIRANRRAEAVLRWIGYAIYALLAFTLYGIVWASSAFTDIMQEAPNTVADGIGKLTVLLICLGIWLLYLGFELIPKLRNQYEQEELEKYRAEHPDSENTEDHPSKPISRWGLSKSKPRSPLPRSRRH